MVQTETRTETMSKTVLVALSDSMFDEETLAQLCDLLPDMDIVRTTEKAEMKAILPDIEIVVGTLPYDLLADATSLRWVQQWGAGADWLLRHPEVADLDFVLTNASGIHSVPISEHIFAFLLAFARRMDQAARAQSERIWVSNRWQRQSPTISPDQQFDFVIGKDRVFELAGKTMLLIGVGAIGERTAKIASAFDMHVIGMRRNVSLSVPGVERMVSPDQLLDVLPEADFVVITAPLTPATQHMIDKRALDAMKPTAYIINIGRGGTIVESDLIDALQSGTIAGAGLDVFEQEPLPEDSPLWGLENVIMTSHYSGLTPEYDARGIEIFLDNLTRYQQGEPLRNVVDKRLGY
jgi:phosphoglycerate dehydrogenase-like enzyme